MIVLLNEQVDAFRPLSKRNPAGNYCVRINRDGEDVRGFLRDYRRLVAMRGVQLDDGLPNPMEEQLRYLQETLGANFETTKEFLAGALQRWLPECPAQVRDSFSEALDKECRFQMSQGKTPAMIRNFYSKVMIWLYYYFRGVLNFFGQDDAVRVLICSDQMSKHEQFFLKMLAGAGSDVVVVEKKTGPVVEGFQELYWGQRSFDASFRLKQMGNGEQENKLKLNIPTSSQEKQQTVLPVQQPKREIIPENYFQKPARKPCINTWMPEKSLEQATTSSARRGLDKTLFYTCLIRVSGTNEPDAYVGKLYAFYQKLVAAQRNVLLLDGGIPEPEPKEINDIRRRNNYRSAEEMMVDLATNLPQTKDEELLKESQLAFIQVMKDAAKQEDNLQKLLTKAVTLLCWIRRYFGTLFGKTDEENSCCILMGGCRDDQQAMLIKFWSLLPTDVVIFMPDLHERCAFKDAALLELRGEHSLPLMRYPTSLEKQQLRTVAAVAQNELNSQLYAGTGVYQNYQLSKANTVVLQTTYDEMFRLWNEKLSYRPGFTVQEGLAILPVLFASVCGVEKGNVQQYWTKILKLKNKDTIIVRGFPYISPWEAGEYHALALRVVQKDGLQREKLKNDPQYPFGMLRPEMQEHMLDKLEWMLKQRLIRGTFERGVEYTVVETVLGLKREILHMLHSFDFAGGNPKLLCVCASEEKPSLQDAILLNFLSLVGFDVAIFVPTGFQTIEQYQNERYPVIHQTGEYLFDLLVPDLAAIDPDTKKSLLQGLLGRLRRE